MDRSQKGSWAPIGHHKTPFWTPRAGPRLPFGDGLAPKAVPELPQEGPGAKLTTNPPKLTKFRLIFLLIWVRFLLIWAVSVSFSGARWTMGFSFGMRALAPAEQTADGCGSEL